MNTLHFSNKQEPYQLQYPSILHISGEYLEHAQHCRQLRDTLGFIAEAKEAGYLVRRQSCFTYPESTLELYAGSVDQTFITASRTSLRPLALLLRSIPGKIFGNLRRKLFTCQISPHLRCGSFSSGYTEIRLRGPLLVSAKMLNQSIYHAMTEPAHKHCQDE